MSFILFINSSWNINSCRKCVYIWNEICEIVLGLRDETNTKVKYNIYKNTNSNAIASFLTSILPAWKSKPYQMANEKERVGRTNPDTNDIHQQKNKIQTFVWKIQ